LVIAEVRVDPGKMSRDRPAPLAMRDRDWSQPGANGHEQGDRREIKSLPESRYQYNGTTSVTRFLHLLDCRG